MPRRLVSCVVHNLAKLGLMWYVAQNVGTILLLYSVAQHCIQIDIACCGAALLCSDDRKDGVEGQPNSRRVYQPGEASVSAFLWQKVLISSLTMANRMPVD